MLRLDKSGNTLRRLPAKTLAEAGLLERPLQQMISQHADAFFAELDEDEPLLLIGQEVKPTDFEDDRIDLLAIDKEGTIVVIELKRGNNKLQLLQALGYVGMIAKWPPEKFLLTHAQTGKSTDESREEIEQFLESQDISTLNKSQRIILLAETYDYEVLVAAEWLTEKHNVDIRCYRLALSTEGENNFLSCTCIYPPKEITEHAKQRKEQGPTPAWTDWETALSQTDNLAVADFFRNEVRAGRENNFRYRRIQWRLNGKRRFRANARRKYAMVTQYGRFPDDLEHWTDELGNDIKIRERDHGSSLRFLLQTKEQFQKLPVAIDRLKDTAFDQGADAPESEDPEDENGSSQ